MIGSLSHYLHGFLHPRWLFGMSSISGIILVTGMYVYFVKFVNFKIKCLMKFW